MPTPAGISLSPDQIAMLRAARKAAGITQEDMAGYLGVTRFALIGYERGRFRPGIDVLRAWAARVGYEVEERPVLITPKSAKEKG